jgi:hypothetical protein
MDTLDVSAERQVIIIEDNEDIANLLEAALNVEGLSCSNRRDKARRGMRQPRRWCSRCVPRWTSSDLAGPALQGYRVRLPGRRVLAEYVEYYNYRSPRQGTG